MSVARACQRCRAAKAKCDLVRPTCGRCARRGQTCSGFPEDTVFIFRDENEAAQRNSQRARRERRQNLVIVASSPSNIIPMREQLPVAADVIDESLLRHYSWLNERAFSEVPGPLGRNIETRALERFFANWTLHPSNHGTSPGHMHDLPFLYHSAPPESLLWLAVRAVAFADMRHESAGTTQFSVKAQQHYGAALNRMRTMIIHQQDLGNDLVLAAMLLIDNFELMYLARTDPPGPHSEAIKHILRSRGDGQLYHPTRFSLWRLAHYRLQSWQILLREKPDPKQIEWARKLNIDRPDLHICADVLQMNILSAVAKTLTEKIANTETMRAEKLEEARQLAKEMQDLTVTIERWTSEMTEAWKPKVDDPQNIASPQEVDELPNFPIPHFPYPQLLNHHDIWLAFIWNFYAASQIMLRESLVDVINYAATLQSQDEGDRDDMTVIQNQRDWVDTLSAAIIQSFPMLLGFTRSHEDDRGPRLVQQGKMAGRLFSLFSMRVIERAQFTTAQHKQTASEVIAWINSRHRLT